MSLYVIYEDIKAHGFETVCLIYLLLNIVEVSPLKLNPWTAIKRSAQRFFTGDVAKKIENIEKSQNDIAEKFEKTQALMHTRFSEIDQQMINAFEALSEELKYSVAMTSRFRLISAADDIINGIEISMDRLEVLLQDDMPIYTMYCDTHPNYKNHKGQKSVQILLEYESLKIRQNAEESFLNRSEVCE